MFNGKSILITGGTGPFGKKNVKTLLAKYSGVPQTLSGTIVEANATRKDFSATEVLMCEPGYGFLRLVMKVGSDSSWASSIRGVMKTYQSKRY